MFASLATRFTLHTAAILLACIVALAPTPSAAREPAWSTHGMVAADHPLASAAGLEVLKKGGNAVDAACAAAFAWGVANPGRSGLGGGAFILVRPPGKQKPVMIDARETAPAAARPDMYTQQGRTAESSQLGGLAVAVPGELAGCSLAIARYGRLALKDALAPALRFARSGFDVNYDYARSAASVVDFLPRFPRLVSLYFPGGKPPAIGTHLTNQPLAESIAAIVTHGPDIFYKGWIAQDIVKTVTDAGGILTAADLAQYRPKMREPIRHQYREFEIITAPPPSSGGIAIIAALKVLSRLNIRAMGIDSPRYLHALAETLKHVFADRARYGSDPDFHEVPITRLTSDAYADDLARRVLDRTQKLDRYGTTEIALPKIAADHGTSHVSVVDANGFAVALTSTINTNFGSMLAGERSGIVLNNEMDDFNTRPSEANAFGLRQGERNAVAAGKRPLSSMSPTIITRNGKVVLVVGGSGGPRIVTATLQVIINILEFGLNSEAAVNHARIHHQLMPDVVFAEHAIPAATVEALRSRGHTVEVQAKNASAPGAVSAVLVDGKKLYGATDPRKMGVVQGY